MFSKRATSGSLVFHWDKGYIESMNENAYAQKQWQVRSLSPFRK